MKLSDARNFRNLRLRTRVDRSRVRAVMASPPSVTYNNTLTHTITSPRLWAPVVATGAGINNRIGGNCFTYSKAANPTILGTTNPLYNFATFRSLLNGTLANSHYQVSFFCEDSELEIYIREQSGNVLVKVDGEYISIAGQATAGTGSAGILYIPFGSRKRRRIDFIATGANAFGGVFTNQTGLITPAPLRGPRTIIMGDSFTVGTGASTAESWVQAFADAMGWDDVWPSGIGGSGYLQPGTGVKYRDRLTQDVSAFSPDLIIFTGGINDNSNWTAAQILDEARLLFAQAKAENPKAVLAAVAPFWKGPASSVNANYWAISAAIKTAVTEVGGLFIDILEMPLNVGFVPQANTLAAAAAAVRPPLA